MSKGKRKHGKKKKGAVASTAKFWMPLAREIVGNFAGQAMAHHSTKSSKSADEKQQQQQHQHHPQKRRDIASEVLRVLGESGPRSIAELITETGTGLSPLMRALRDSRDFRLVELVGDADVVQLTPAGSRVASALRRDAIEADGRKLLES
jgi:hypothetical protein